MYLVCAALFIMTVAGLIVGYRRLASRAELERAEELLALEIDALDDLAPTDRRFGTGR